MELSHLEAFLETARRGSFRRAAIALFLSQPAVSNRINRLEEELGGTLFYRRGRRGATLTDKGLAFLPFAEQSLAVARAGQKFLQDMDSGSGRRLFVGAGNLMGTYLLPDIVAELRTRREIEINVVTRRSDRLLEMVLSKEIDVGLSIALAHPDVECIVFYDDVVVLAIHPDHRLAGAGQVTVHDVAKEALIHSDAGPMPLMFDSIRRAFAAAGMVPSVSMVMESIEGAKQMVERGLGVSFLPLCSIRREVQLGSISYVHFGDNRHITLPLGALVLRYQQHSPVLEAFLELLKEHLGRVPGTTPSQEEREQVEPSLVRQSRPPGP